MCPTKFIYTTKKEHQLAYYAFFPKSVPRSCVICIHGGGWQSDSAERLFKHAEYFAENGAVGISIEYRLNSADTDVRDGLYDCTIALMTIRKMLLEKYGKVFKIIAFGDSAGGYYACCLGNKRILEIVNPNVNCVDFVVDLNGIVDLTGKWSYGIFSYENKSLLHLYSPLWNVSDSDAPTLIMHGSRDKTVDIFDSIRYAEALEMHGIAHDFYIIDGAAHAFILFDYTHDNLFVFKQLERIAEYLKSKSIL